MRGERLLVLPLAQGDATGFELRQGCIENGQRGRLLFFCRSHHRGDEEKEREQKSAHKIFSHFDSLHRPIPIEPDQRAERSTLRLHYDRRTDVSGVVKLSSLPVWHTD